MALRLHTRYFSRSGLAYEIEIHDSSYAGSTIDFKTSPEGAVITTEGGSRDLVARIYPTKARIDVLVEDDDHRDFITDLAAAGDEERFHVIVKEGSTAIFTGYIFVDTVEHEDRKSVFYFSFSAICGLAKMKGARWDPDAIAAGGVFVTPLGVILKAFETVNIRTFYLGTDFLYEAIHWYEDNSGLTAASSTLDNYYLPVKAFYDDERGEYVKCWQAIKDVLDAFNARIYFSRGAFYVERMNARKTANVTYHVYDGAGTKSTSLVNSDYTIDWADRWVDQGGSFSYLSPINRIELTFNGVNFSNLLRGYNWNNDNNNTAYEVGYLLEGDKLTDLIFYLNRSRAAAYERYLYDITIKLIGTTTDYWLKSEAPTPEAQASIVLYDFPEWVTSAYTIRVYGIPINFTVNPFDPVSYNNLTDVFRLVNIPAVPEDGRLEITVNYLGVYNTDFTTPYAGADPVTFNTNNSRIVVNNLPDRKTTFYRLVNSTKNSDVLEIETNLGDSNESGNVKRFFNLDFTPTVSWNDSGKDIQTNLLADLMNIRETTRWMFRGSFFRTNSSYTFGPQGRLIYRAKTFLFLHTEFETRTDTFSGEFVEITAGAVVVTAPETQVFGDSNSPPLILAPNDQNESVSNNGTVTVGTTVTTVTVTPLVTHLYEGDIITIVNADGGSQDFEVDTDAAPGDTTVSVTSVTAGDTFVAGDEVFITHTNYYDRANLKVEVFANVAAAEVTATETLPDITGLSDNIINKRVKVYVNGVLQFYASTPTKIHHYGIDNINNKITWAHELRGADVYLQFYKPQI